MCGIAGMAGTKDVALLKRMLEITRHRGPDDSGTYASPGQTPADRIAIGNNRLSIIDLSPSGHQPMSNEDGRIWVAYNGEIYNFPELRRELVEDGHTFRSKTDTEILVHLWEKHGPDMAKRLNGIFAFTIWDSNSQELFVFRDRLGIKPLYYSQVGDRLYFASEIKALLQCQEIDPAIDPAAVGDYLTLLYIPNPSTIFKNIFKLQAGHQLRWKNGEIQITPYWNLSYGNYFTESTDELATRLRELMIEATKRQLISDVPVGFFLSGGLDSSALVACAAQFHDASLNCYSIAFKQEHARLEQSGDDPHYARLVADHFGAKFNEITVDPEVASLLPKVVWHLDQPIADPAAISTHLICEYASEKVLISGQGADEIFGGYRVHRAHKTAALLRALPKAVRDRLLPSSLKWLGRQQVPGISPGLLMAGCRFTNKLLRVSAMQPAEQYAALRSYLLEDDLRNLLSPDANAALAERGPLSRFLGYFADVSSEEYLNQMLYVDAKTFLQDLNLAYTDKLSMASSVEVRVPFLDNEVVDFASRLPVGLKIHGHTQKYILRKAMAKMLPESILQRRKAGFGLPIRSWLKHELRPMLHDLLSEERVARRGLLNPRVVTRMIRDHESGAQDLPLQLWALLTLEVWHSAVLDSRAVVNSEAVLN
jgi:asparagine synthase (glutamine-hydrolysing)